MSLNKVMLIGHVGKDPEVRYFKNSDPTEKDALVARFSLATDSRLRDGKEITEWHNITAWRAGAVFVEKYVRKGCQVFIEGHLHTETWTDHNGTSHTSAEVIADNIQILGRKEEEAPSKVKAESDCCPEEFPSDGLIF